ncbi:Spherulation-specific family 4 [Gymnopilus junonius]|uniref:Spherulation-specific family 4 n=1 Tax=Gymnopilus junonius TaxID=109634 RepID=A0A9P5NZX2_GYMJU|nr:Spherulation-specific family 4 [Gymnopilus junonius]
MTYALVPLYIYPTTGAWNTLFTSISANPSLTFQVVVNPNSGPGDTQYPNSDYVAALVQLNSYPNVQTLGYVHTSWAARSIADVEAEVDIYAGWAGYTGADIHVDGIFFDEAVAEYNTSTLNYINSISAHARSQLGAGRQTVVLNPGEVVDTRWYATGDVINVFENSFAAFSLSTLEAAVPSSVRKNSTVAIYSFTGTAAQQTTTVDSLVAAGFAGVYVTTQNGYTVWSTLWAQFTSALAAVA